jgi:RHS repeat-associated protein
VLADDGSNKIHKARWLTPDPLDGNLTQDSVHTYTWNGNGDLVGVDSTSATYDAFDRVVEISNGSPEQVVYGPGGGKLALMNGQTLQQALVPLAGGAEAVYTPGGLAWYRHPDWLGSSRLASTPSRTVYYDGAYAPYGESYAESGTADPSFTGQNQDTAPSGAYPLYDFMAREYHPTWGRWLSPDPTGGDVTNPQSLNRYAYVDNNPASLTDPLGLDPCSDPEYYYSHAECGGPPPGDCEEYDLGSCSGNPFPPLGGYGGGGGGGGGTVSSAPPAGQPPLVGGNFVGGATAGAAGQDVIDLTRWGPLWNVLVRACGSCAQVLEGVAGSAGYGVGILGGLIMNPTVVNRAEADWHPGKVVPVAPAQTQAGLKFEVCTYIEGSETIDPVDPSQKVCYYQCPTLGVKSKVQAAWERCRPKINFGSR